MIACMRIRTVISTALVSLMPIGETVVIGAGAIFTTAMLILFSPQKAQAEIWSCTYQFDEETRNWVRRRDGNQFVSSYNSRSKIIRENENVIHLYNSYSEMENYYASVLHKKRRMFSMVALNPGDDTRVIYGPCEISY